MPILFQYRNIRHILGMYITKQPEQEIYLIESDNGAPTRTHTHSTSKLPVGATPLSRWSVGLNLTKFDSRLSIVFGNGLDKTAGVRRREKQEEETASGKSMFLKRGNVLLAQHTPRTS